jgi:flagellar biosynthesis protein FlhG
MQAKTVKRNTEVIGIASGKGGVGKTTLSTNLAVALTMMNKKVMLLDGDLGLANAQIALGCKTQYNLSHVIAGEKNAERNHCHLTTRRITRTWRIGCA